MTEKGYESSDSIRSARPLRYGQAVTLGGPVRLALGGVLPDVTVFYETYGRLNEARDNAVLICHALSGDSHVARHDPSDDPGWWEVVVGPGKPIDTDRYFVICPNILGGCRGTTGPNSVNPATAKPYGRDFPGITIGDMVDVQRRLIDHLGIRQLLAVVGGSMGGHQVLQWAVQFPDRLRSAIPLATSPRLTSQALAFDIIGRNAITNDPKFCDGQYYVNGHGPSVGLAIARMLGHITYLSREAMREKFEANRLHPRDISTTFEKRFSVGSYLAYQGDRFVERFDANSYIALTLAMDLFDLGDGQPQLADALGPSRCRWMVISFSSDWLFPPDQSQQIVSALAAAGKPVSYCNVPSACGHDAFLLGDDVAVYGEILRGFLSNQAGAPDSRKRGQEPFSPSPPSVAEKTCKKKVPDPFSFSSPEPDPYGEDVTSIFHGRRVDYDQIVELIPPSSSVLDLGCGNCGLLARLKARGHRRLAGVELDEQAVLAAARRDVDVIQADLNRGSLPFTDKQFDCVVLSQTLQAVRDVPAVIDEMLRIGRQGIVSFPNLAYHEHLAALAERGRAPETTRRYRWYDTPNIRFFSIGDFEDYCQEKGIQVARRIFLDTRENRQVTQDPNRRADLAIFVLRR